MRNPSRGGADERAVYVWNRRKAFDLLLLLLLFSDSIRGLDYVNNLRCTVRTFCPEQIWTGLLTGPSLSYSNVNIWRFLVRFYPSLGNPAFRTLIISFISAALLNPFCLTYCLEETSDPGPAFCSAFCLARGARWNVWTGLDWIKEWWERYSHCAVQHMKRILIKSGLLWSLGPPAPAYRAVCSCLITTDLLTGLKPVLSSTC